MSKLKPFVLVIWAALCLLIVESASATLQDRGPNMVYDDFLDITWTRQAGDGVPRNWDASKAWVEALVFDGYSDWRLPYMDPGCNFGGGPPIGCSELDYMFYHNLAGTILENKTGTQTAVGGQILTGIVDYYWTSSEVSRFGDLDWAGIYLMQAGYHVYYNKGISMGAWAVRDGDVALAVPEPESYAMLLAGLGLLGFIVHRRQHAA